MSTACQKAVRQFYNVGPAINIELELSLVKKLMMGFQPNNLMMDFLKSHEDSQEAEMADRLLQPVEHSYTIESLHQLICKCNLEYVTQCVNQWDANGDLQSWNMKFKSSELQASYDILPDKKRWQISNLLMLNNSPMLWFYFQRKDAGGIKKTEIEICNDFLNTTFCKNSFMVKNYVLDNGDSYKLTDNAVRYPLPASPQHPLATKIFDAIKPNVKIKDLFGLLKIKPSFSNVNDVRIRLTTSAFPYLLANG